MDEAKHPVKVVVQRRRKAFNNNMGGLRSLANQVSGVRMFRMHACRETARSHLYVYDLTPTGLQRLAAKAGFAKEILRSSAVPSMPIESRWAKMLRKQPQCKFSP